MTRRYLKDCSGAPVGALTHTYAPEGLIWYCADHSPNGDHFHDQTLMAVRVALERIATALEKDLRHKLGPWDGEIRKVTPEKWETLTPFERHWSRTD